MARRTRIRQGMVVRDREGKPLGRVLAVDDGGFVLERRVVIAREFRVELGDVEAVKEAGVVLARMPEGAEDFEQDTEMALAVDLPRTEVIWSPEHAHAAMREESSGLCNNQGRVMVEVTEHVGAYPVQVESGHVPSPRYLPWSQEEPEERSEEPEEPAPTRH